MPDRQPAGHERRRRAGKALANEVNVIWTYTASKQVNVNVFAAYAVPGAGYKDLYASQGGSARAWSGFGAQVNVNY